MAYSRGRCLLKQRLAERGIKQADLARRTNIHPRLISHYVNDTKPMPPNHMYTIAKSIGVNMEDLYEWVWTGK